ncbi:MAG: YihY/virulence factor BrkB family protein [Acidimicrobiia bacterium]
MQGIVDGIVPFVKRWVRDWTVLSRRGDPLLMGAAIAFNSLFALVPLAIAFVAIVTLFERSKVFFEDLVEFLESTLPPDVAVFLGNILAQSLEIVSGKRSVILAVSILVALWSGSRAVYAIQKSLRLVQGTVDERGYVRIRATGIVVTVAGGVAVMAAYLVMLIGGGVWRTVSDWLGLPGIGITQALAIALALAWVYLLLWVIYRYGPPEPVSFAWLTAAIVTAVLGLGTMIAVNLLPNVSSQAVAVFGSVGLALLWLYYIGVVVVAAPIGILSFLSAWEDSSQR